MGSETRWGIALGVALLLALLVGYYAWFHQPERTPSGSTPREARPGASQAAAQQPSGAGTLTYEAEVPPPSALSGEEPPSSEKLATQPEPATEPGDEQPSPALEEVPEEDEEWGSISGVVIDEWGSPVEGARIWAGRTRRGNRAEAGANQGDDQSGDSGNRQRRRRAEAVESDDEGRFLVEGLPAGTYRVRAWTYRHIAGEAATVELAPAEAYEGLVLTLSVGESLEGRVISQLTGEGLADARIDGSPRRGQGQAWRRTQSDDEGYFKLTGLTAGEWSVRARVPGFIEQRSTFEVTADGGPPVEIALEPGASLAGQVLGPDGEPLAKVGIYLLEGERYREQTTSDDDGTYLTDAVKPGLTYRLYARSREQGVLHTQEVMLSQPGVTEMDIFLEPAGQISGVVIDEDGQAVARASVTVEATNGQVTRRERTEDDGTFEIGSLYGGSYTIRARAEDYAPSEVIRFEVAPAGRAPEVVLALSRASSLNGVVYAAGSPVDRAIVAVYPVDAEADGRSTGRRYERTEEDGSYSLAGLGPGSYDVFVRSGDYAYLDRQVLQVGNAERLALDLQLFEAATVEGVLLAHGGSTEGLSVVARSLPHRRVTRRGSVGEDGSFRLEGLYPGDYQLLVRGRGLPDGGRPLTVISLGRGQQLRGLQVSLQQ